MALRKDGVDVDVIGQIGFDPGAQWGTGFVSTADNTIRRKASVNAGDTNGADVFDPAMEWDGFDTDIFDGLGSHNTEVAPTVASKTPDDGATDVALGSNISVTFSEPVTVTGSWFTISCGSSGAHTATVTGGPTTFTLDPDVDFGASEVCTVTVIAAQVADQDVSDPPDNMAANAPFSFTTAGVVNVCEQPFTHTYEIQGSGNSAAITGNVTTQGVVVGDFEGPITAGIQGFYLQDASGDSDAATSDGIYRLHGRQRQRRECGRLAARHRLCPRALQPDDPQRQQQQ